MKKTILDDVCNYLSSFKKATLLNKDMLMLSKKIENFCFKCNKQSPYIGLNDISNDNFESEDFTVKSSEENECISDSDIDSDSLYHIDHDLLNKYLTLSDYLKDSSDREVAASYLNDLITDKNLTYTDIINKSFLDTELLNCILNNKLEIKKDSAIKLCFGLGLNYQESTDLLLRFGYVLSPLCTRDCIIRYGLNHNLALDEVDYILEESYQDSLIVS